MDESGFDEASRGRKRWVFDEPDFRRLWLVGLVVFAVRWLEMLVVGVFVYQRTGSPFDVALMMLLRMVPMALFGAVIGAVAERVQRRTALFFVVLSMLTSSLTLMLLAHAGALAIWHLAAASFWNGLGWATDNPIRRVMIGEVVGPDWMSSAMSIDIGANNASRMLGPTLGGVLLATAGIDGAFMVSVSLYVVALAAVLGLRYRNRGAPTGGGAVWSRMIEGFALVRRDRRLVGTLLVTVIYNVFGWPFTSMIPVIGQDNLNLGPQGIGVLASMDGVGAFCGAVAMALYARPMHYARLYVGGVGVYLLMIMMFALMAQPLPAGAALLLTGLSSAAFSIMQATLVYLAAPADMRSRLYGVLSVCIGSGPIGFVHLGILAELIGAPAASVASAAEGLLALALTWGYWRSIGTIAQS